MKDALIKCFIAEWKREEEEIRSWYEEHGLGYNSYSADMAVDELDEKYDELIQRIEEA